MEQSREAGREQARLVTLAETLAPTLAPTLNAIIMSGWSRWLAMICKQSDGNAVDSAIPELAKSRVLLKYGRAKKWGAKTRSVLTKLSRSVRRDGIC